MAGLLLVNPAVIFHRSVVVDASIGSDLYLFNDGDASLNVTVWALTTGTKFRIEEFTGFVPSFAMAAGATAKVRIWFEPKSAPNVSGITTSLTIDIDDTTVALTVSSSAGFAEGDYVLKDDECMKIQTIVGLDWTVLRGQQGTTAVAHTSGYDDVYLVTFDVNTLLSDTLTITNTGSVTPITVSVSGWAQKAGSSRLSISPSSWSFDWVDGQDFTGGIILDQESNELHLMLVSSGNLPLTIYAINVLYPLRLLPPIPVLPSVLLPGTSLLLFLTLISRATGTQTLDDLLEVLSDDPIGSELYVVAYTGLALTSAYPVTGTVKALLSFGITLKSASTTDFACEETASLKQTTNLGGPFVDKAFTQLSLKYEDLGQSIVSATVVAGGFTGYVETAIGTVGADNSIKEALFTSYEEGEYAEVTLGVGANAGPVSITEIAYRIDEGKELSILGSLPAVVTAYSVTGGPQCLFAFGSSTQKTEPTNLACEAAASLTQTTNFGGPFVDKSPFQFRLKYEDLGQSTVAVTTVAGSYVGYQEIAIGTVGADNLLKEGVATFHVEGEYAVITLDVGAGAGPVSITEMAYGIDEWSEFSVLGGLPAVASAYPVSATPLGLFTFGSTVLKANPTNLDCEEAAYFVRTHDFQLSGSEKHIPYATIKYEDLGVAAFSLTAKSKRETIGPISVTIGTGGADKLVKWTQTNLAINEEIIEFTLNRAALGGPLSFTEELFRVEPRGEVREGT